MARHACAPRNLFSTAGCPVSEFSPAFRRSAPRGCRFCPRARVGNVFCDGALSSHSVRLGSNGPLHVTPSVTEELPQRVARLNASSPDVNLHASTLPVGRDPAVHECDPGGQVAALPGLPAIDSTCLPALPSTPHMVTVAANADRI